MRRPAPGECASWSAASPMNTSSTQQVMGIDPRNASPGLSVPNEDRGKQAGNAVAKNASHCVADLQDDLVRLQPVWLIRKRALLVGFLNPLQLLLRPSHQLFVLKLTPPDL